jgi:hypothetical protein
LAEWLPSVRFISAKGDPAADATEICNLICIFDDVERRSPSRGFASGVVPFMSDAGVVSFSPFGAGERPVT